ncbi:MAG: NTP transferase domain-containing protein [Oscillospiraceae bacterium]|nr:NTP transferase domain-containing protein [Oscillospiraceae bacterium]MCL2277870.1 NTP transferase domain-containing protein [Oscillospiraceae bacterium]
MKISAILLAAGLSRRMGEDKLLLIHNGQSLLSLALSLLSELTVFERFVVTTEMRRESVETSENIRFVLNNNPQIGQSESIKLGVSEATGSHFMFLVADQPRLKVSALKPIFAAVREVPDKIVFPLVRGRPSSPAVFPARFKPELLALSGDMGGREVRRAFPDLCFGVDIENPDDFLDVDDKSDYGRIEKI